MEMTLLLDDIRSVFVWLFSHLDFQNRAGEYYTSLGFTPSDDRPFSKVFPKPLSRVAQPFDPPQKPGKKTGQVAKKKKNLGWQWSAKPTTATPSPYFVKAQRVPAWPSRRLQSVWPNPSTSTQPGKKNGAGGG